MAKLTPKQKRFVDEYLIDLNATQAAIRAGYSEKSAYSIGIENLNKPEIQKEVEKRKADRERRTEITQDRVIKELAKIAFSNGSEFARVIEKPMTDPFGNPVLDTDGNPILCQRVEMVLTDELTDDQRAAIAGIKEGKNGIEVSTCDKVKALELLGRHLGIFEDKVKMETVGPVQIIDNIPRGKDNGS